MSLNACVYLHRTVVWCVCVHLVLVWHVHVHWPLPGSAAPSARGFAFIGGKNTSPALPSHRPLIPALRAPAWSVWWFLTDENEIIWLCTWYKIKSCNWFHWFQLVPLLIRMRWWTVRGDLVQSGAPTLSLQTPAAPSVTPVCMRVSCTLTVKPSNRPPARVSAARVSEALSPVCPWSAHQRLVPDQ